MTDKKKETVVPTNPALVEFPRDQWGMTSELRKAGLRAAGSVRGNKEKYALLVATLRVIAQHAAARFNVDGDLVANRLAKIEAMAAAPHRRIAASASALPDTPVAES